MPARVLTGSVMQALCLEAMRYIPASCTHTYAAMRLAHLQISHGATFPAKSLWCKQYC